MDSAAPMVAGYDGSATARAAVDSAAVALGGTADSLMHQSDLPVVVVPR